MDILSLIIICITIISCVGILGATSYYIIRQIVAAKEKEMELRIKLSENDKKLLSSDDEF